jgi:thiamine biosynthesis lipoprotein
MRSPLPAIEEIRRARPLLGTLVEIRAAAPGPSARVHAAVDAAFEAIAVVQRLMSYHEPGSELSRLNLTAASQPQQVSVHTYAVLAAALRLAQLSEGAFDPCVGAHLEAWGYLPAKAPQSGSGTFRDVELLEACAVRLRRPVRLDFGGIAKGYAVDLAVQTLAQHGVEEIVVNAGGDLRVSGARTHRVRVRHPLAPLAAGHEFELTGAALTTSAAYFSRRRLGSQEVSALLDPRSGRPYLEDASVSVRAPDCMSADALTKVVLFAPESVAQRALAACGAQALILRPDAAPCVAQLARAAAVVVPRGACRAPHAARARRRLRVQ